MPLVDAQKLLAYEEEQALALAGEVTKDLHGRFMANRWMHCSTTAFGGYYSPSAVKIFAERMIKEGWEVRYRRSFPFLAEWVISLRYGGRGSEVSPVYLEDTLE